MENTPGISTGVPVKIKSFLIQCVRVWHLLKKPTKDEFMAISKVSAVGMLIIGAIGFIVSDLVKWIGG